MAKSFNLIVLFVVAANAFGQVPSDQAVIRNALTRTQCYASFINQNTYVPPPPNFVKHKGWAKTKSATIEVQYINFSDEARIAFQEAVDIWESVIQSDVTIHITAFWEPLSTGVLGSASPGSYVMNAEGVQRRNVWYPIALAEKITGQDINSTSSPDIVASFNSDYDSWYFGSTGTPQGKFDFITIVLHEIGHGLGITHGYTVQGTLGTISNFFNERPVVYESFLENNAAVNLLTSFSIPSTELKKELTNDNLFFNGPNVLANNSNQRGKIYAPAAYSSGSSIAHLDETTYPAGDPNSLMTPQIGFAEGIHDPGPIVLGILDDIGWTGITVQHAEHPNTEEVNTPYEIRCTINSDLGYEDGTVALSYRTGGESFTSVEMSPTGTVDEFSADIPAAGTASTYEYFISVENSSGMVFTNPGKNYIQGNPVEPHYFSFEAGPDTEAPVVAHQAKPFLLEGDTELELEATVRDNIGISSVIAEYLINEVPQGSVPMPLFSEEDSLYTATLVFPALSLNDKVKYRIVATDNATAQNVSQFPAFDFIELNAEGLAPTQDFYNNDFNSASEDFFGNGFSITTPSTFTDGAIHSDHPYTEGNGLPGDELNLIYQLRIPIRIQSAEANIRFDEIVLVEPGENGSSFGNESFFDYVVVEGSDDGGVTWKPVSDGYDSRDHSPWLTKYNSAMDGNISTAVGDPSLFRTRTISLLDVFNPDDEVVIRFRLFSDPFAAGWGWAIDNLRIQIDETPPEIYHDHVDYILSNATPLVLNLRVTDANELEYIAIDYFVNEESLSTYEFLLTEFTDQYSLELDISELQPEDNLNYKIRTSDTEGNESTLPGSGFFVAPFIDVSNSVSQYFSDFNTVHDDFAGNFFSIGQPDKFTSNIFQTDHDYQTGLGLDTTSNLVAILKTPIIVNTENPYISFDEIALLDPNDHFTVEASKDEGVTWIELTEPYNSESSAAWNQAWINQKAGEPALFRNRFFSLIESGDFIGDDKILIRFRLFTNKSISGWGWAMDNLSIQGPVTGLETFLNEPDVRIYPNPVTNHVLNIAVDNMLQQPTTFQCLNLHGTTVYSENMPENSRKIERQINVAEWPAGFYVLRTQIGATLRNTKFLVSR